MTDVVNFDSLPAEKKELILSICRLPEDEMGNEDKPVFMEMSTLLGNGVMEVRARACDELLVRRVEAKLRAGAASLREGSIANRLYIAQPKSVLADRPPQIPESVIRKRGMKRTAADAELPTLMDIDSSDAPPTKKPMTLRERELAEGDEFYLNLRDEWLLKNPKERNDIILEIIEGHNVFDYFDPDIEAKLNQLEEQEKQF
nr:nucleolar gtp binding protein [Hymenolepis microstoma]